MINFGCTIHTQKKKLKILAELNNSKPESKYRHEKLKFPHPTSQT